MSWHFWLAEKGWGLWGQFPADGSRLWRPRWSVSRGWALRSNRPARQACA